MPSDKKKREPQRFALFHCPAVAGHTAAQTARFIRVIGSTRRRDSIDGHSDCPSKRAARKSTNERTFADT